MQTLSASQQITEEVTSWPGVTAGPGRRGEFAFRVGRREIGHLHGDRTAHFGFPKQVGVELRAEGRVGPHPVNPESPAWAARRIEGESDVRAVIELMRLNYDRAVDRHGLPAWSGTPVEGLLASAPHALPFAPSLHVRAFRLERASGDLAVYAAPAMETDGISRHYLNHRHEAMFAPETTAAPLFVHAGDRDAVAKGLHVRGSFSRRHALDEDLEVIPTPGHTPGATAYLWDTGERRLLFTGDTIYLSDGEWVDGLLESSDRAGLVASLELIRELDFDVLVPWAATAGQPYVAFTDRDDAQRRIEAVIERVRAGGSS
jgi:hypothetical protein